MAYNLTYDPSGDPTALAEEEARDQESYEIGERLDQAQNELLAGKYRDAEELEQAYVELQRKLGSRETEQPVDEAEVEQAEEQEEESTEDVDYSFLERLAAEANTGEFSEELLDALGQLSGADVADMFLAYQQNNQSTVTNEISPEEISQLKGVAGGDEAYGTMIQWASQNLQPGEIEVYDAVMDGGDPNAIFFAIQALKYRYQDSVGFEGELLTGRSAVASNDAFRSQAEVVRAMNDPRYDSDPAYRNDVFEKLERSNLPY